ncbi:mCG146117, partial [Mus musculus]
PHLFPWTPCSRKKLAPTGVTWEYFHILSINRRLFEMHGPGKDTGVEATTAAAAANPLASLPLKRRRITLLFSWTHSEWSNHLSRCRQHSIAALRLPLVTSFKGDISGGRLKGQGIYKLRSPKNPGPNNLSLTNAIQSSLSFSTPSGISQSPHPGKEAGNPARRAVGNTKSCCSTQAIPGAPISCCNCPASHYP